MAGASVVEENGSKITTHRRIIPSASRGELEEITREGPERETVDYREEEEVMPDGTIHTRQVSVHHKVKHVHRSRSSKSGEEEDVYDADEEVPGSEKEDVYEMFDSPAKVVHDEEDIEQELPDGTKVKKHVVMNRMVHLVKMHHESIDESGNRQEEDFEIEEVIPGTESTFVAGLDSDYEEEMEEKRQRQLSGDQSRGAGAMPPPQNVAYQHQVDPQEYTEEAGRYDSEEAKGQRIVQQTMNVVDQMLASGDLTLDEFRTTTGISHDLPTALQHAFLYLSRLRTRVVLSVLCQVVSLYHKKVGILGQYIAHNYWM